MGGYLMTKLLSIVIAVYNKEKYLPKCIESIVDLDIDKTKIEAIFVDDLSTDDSRNILDQYAQQYDFIKVIKLEQNSGSPSTPRNVGITEADGEYLTILDADDWLDSKGFPKLLFQTKDNQSDIGFGQPFKHTNNAVTRSARFSSYKYANNLIPYEIKNIFRAVGPPGKIFRKDVVERNNIKFQHMQFAEDKLFFIELISKCTRASMSPLAAYHINRYTENDSLVKTTSTLEKAEINLEALSLLLDLDIPSSAKKEAVSRIIEVDFMRRFFHTRTFLKSLNKDIFYNIFENVKLLLSEHELSINDFIVTERFKNILYLYENSSRQELVEYLTHLVYNRNKNKAVVDNSIKNILPEKFNHLIPIIDECLPVYIGTHIKNDISFEVIKVYKMPNVLLNSVLLSKISDERFEKEVSFTITDDTIYIRTEDVSFDDFNINFRIRFDDYKSALVHSSFPNGNKNYLQKRQTFKTELFKVNNTPIVPTENYIKTISPYVVALKNLKCYDDVGIDSNVIDSIEAGTCIKIKDTLTSKAGIPRLLTIDEKIITANNNAVIPLEKDKITDYITEKVHAVKIIKNCKLHSSRSFTNEPLGTLNVDDEILIEDVVYTNKLTPRLKTKDNHYITANLKFIEPIEN